MNASHVDASPLLARAANAGAVTVLHLDDELMSAFAIGPAQLATFEGVRSRDVTDPAAIAELLERLRATPLRGYDGAIDVRWGLLFASASGEPLGSVYLDRFGIAGYVDGAPAAFDDRGAFLAYLHAAYGD